ncbi:hypothetical protein AVEN_125781-1 [Araneus ventricosus]|uniref:Uncharacterized protein n=1 Tax=Araneus ventricosus TaxID=182803 RepID=A0A4Y2WPI8_ARAVE|nr:hypothetical protein AVEN_125781-1 [Araneus ventricosus]
MVFLWPHTALKFYLQLLSTLSEQLDQAFLIPFQNNIHHVISQGKYHTDIAETILSILFGIFSTIIEEKRATGSSSQVLIALPIGRQNSLGPVVAPSKEFSRDREVTHSFEANKCTTVMVY